MSWFIGDLRSFMGELMKALINNIDGIKQKFTSASEQAHY